MNSAKRLVRVVQQLERLEEAKRQAAEDLADAFREATAQGFDAATLKVVLKLRKLTPEQRKERRALEAIYLASLGMLEGDPLTDEARRRLDDEERSRAPKDAPSAGGNGKSRKPDDDDKAPAPEPAAPAQAPLKLKDPEEARQEGRDAADAGKRIYDNPFPAGDPCRAAWDEGWCEQKKSHGMDTPAAFQRRKPPEPKPADKEPPGGEKHPEAG